MDLIKFTSFCTAKEAINKMRRQPMDWEKILANDGNDKGLVAKIYKQLIQLKTKQIKTKKLTQLKHKTLIDSSPKKTYRWPVGT